MRDPSPTTTTATYTYHASGSRATRTDALTGEHWEYDADALGFLREVRKYASSSDTTPFSTITLHYDPLFRLSRIEEDGASIQYQWWEWTLVGEFGDAGGVIRRYIPSYGMDGVGVIQQGGEDLYAVTDTNGSVLKLIDAAQTVRASYRYDPYGRVLEAVGDRAGQPRRFAGALWLQAIGLYYFRMRLMDPEIGQFTSMDSLWTLQIQPYAYCGGKPTRCNDPLGMEGPSTSESARAVGGLAYDQVKGGLEGKALGPLQPLKGMYDAFSGYKPGDNRHNGSVGLKKIGNVTFLDRAPWWKKIVKKVEGFWDMVTGNDKKEKKPDPCKPRIGRVLGSFRGR
jgi:RHS repeat-associated protein